MSIASCSCSLESYKPPRSLGNASRSACTKATFLIMVAGFSFQNRCGVPSLVVCMYSLSVTSAYEGCVWSFRYTLHHPPSRVSSGYTADPSRCVISFSFVLMVMPAVYPSNAGLASALFVNASFPTIVVAGDPLYFTRWTSPVKGFSPRDLHSSRKM